MDLPVAAEPNRLLRLADDLLAGEIIRCEANREILVLAMVRDIQTLLSRPLLLLISDELDLVVKEWLPRVRLDLLG